MRQPQRRPAEILVVEDNEVDCMILRRAFERAKARANLHHVRNGEDCLRFLRRQGDFADVPEPDLVLLDLDMPVMCGRETLTVIARDEALMHLPVVILSSRSDVGEVIRMYRLRCSSFICKPLGLDAYTEMVAGLVAYWLNLVKLPRTPLA